MPGSEVSRLPGSCTPGCREALFPRVLHTTLAPSGKFQLRISTVASEMTDLILLLNASY